MEDDGIIESWPAPIGPPLVSPRDDRGFGVDHRRSERLMAIGKDVPFQYPSRHEHTVRDVADPQRHAASLRSRKSEVSMLDRDSCHASATHEAMKGL
jgi:hypothetical protein